MLPVFSVDVSAAHPTRTFTIQSDVTLPSFRNKDWQKSSSLMLVAENTSNANANAFVIDRVPALVVQHAQGNINIQSVMQNVIEELCNSWEGDPHELRFVSALVNHTSQHTVVAHVGSDHVAAIYSNSGKLVFHSDNLRDVAGVQRRDVHPHACLYSFVWSDLKGNVLLLGSHLAAWKAVDVTVHIEAHSSATEFVQSLQMPVTAIVTRFSQTQSGGGSVAAAGKRTKSTAAKKVTKAVPISEPVVPPMTTPTTLPQAAITKPILKKSVNASVAQETKRSGTKKRKSASAKMAPTKNVTESQAMPSSGLTVSVSPQALFRDNGSITSKYSVDHIVKRANVVEMDKPIANNAAFGNSIIQSAVLQKESDGIVLAFRFTDGTDGSTSELVETQRLSNGDLLFETASGSLYHVTKNVQRDWETN